MSKKKQAQAHVITTALGISTGDRIWTSYGTGGIVTHISRPHYVDEYTSFRGIRTWPVVSVNYDKDCTINDIRQEGDRWFTDTDDEIFIEKAHKTDLLQLDMFETVLEPCEPYEFREGVDYTLNAWSCDKCGDFNAEPESGDMRWHCPTCKRYGVYQLYVMPPREPGAKQHNSYLIHLGARDDIQGG